MIWRVRRGWWESRHEWILHRDSSVGQAKSTPQGSYLLTLRLASVKWLR